MFSHSSFSAVKSKGLLGSRLLWLALFGCYWYLCRETLTRDYFLFFIELIICIFKQLSHLFVSRKSLWFTTLEILHLLFINLAFWYLTHDPLLVQIFHSLLSSFHCSTPRWVLKINYLSTWCQSTTETTCNMQLGFWGLCESLSKMNLCLSSLTFYCRVNGHTCQ